MNETISLGIGGDINLIKSRLLSNPDCVFPISITKDKPEDVITYFNFEYNEDVRILDKYLNVLSEYIIDRYETKFARQILDKNFEYLTQKAKRDILKNIILFSDDKTIGYDARKRIILTALYDCLKENKKFYLDGFISFRLREYEFVLYTLLEKLVDDYNAKKEYEEFIELLRYFVSVQSPRPTVLNIVVNPDNSYSVYDENEKDITANCVTEFIESEVLLTENDYDDLLISVLITAAPEKIVIHKAENIKNSDLFITIKKVFEKVEYCVGCELCLGE